MKESGFRQIVVDLLSPLHAVPIESPMRAGIPDVNFSHGWIELKYIRKWPVRDDSLIIPPHFEPEQRNWLRTRCAKGGRAWLLVKIERAWALFWGPFAADNVGSNITVGDLRRVPAHWSSKVIVWQSQPSSDELMRALLLHKWR